MTTPVDGLIQFGQDQSVPGVATAAQFDQLEAYFRDVLEREGIDLNDLAQMRAVVVGLQQAILNIETAKRSGMNPQVVAGNLVRVFCRLVPKAES